MWKSNQNNNGYSEGNKNTQWDTTKKSHFINIPIEDPKFIESYSKLCSEMQNISLNNFSYEMLQKPGKLHMTVCTLDIGEDQEKIEKVNQILIGLGPEIRNISKEENVNFTVEKYESMGDAKTTRIVYAKMQEDEHFIKLSEIINLIISNLVNEKILSNQNLTDNHIIFDVNDKKYKITLHLTLLNVLFLNKILRKQKQKELKTMNATEVLAYMKDKYLPQAEITQIHFSRMREDKQTQKYEKLYSYNLI